MSGEPGSLLEWYLVDTVRLFQTLAGAGLSEEHILVVPFFSELAFLPTS